jgi:glycopeptide antibiotics resistance protein
MSTRAFRRIALAFLGVVLTADALVALWPTPIDNRVSLRDTLEQLRASGLPDFLRYRALEFGGNILLFVPLGFALALVMPEGRRWMAPTLCVAGSFAAEFIQLVLRPDRFADPTDLLANSIGGVIGTVLVVGLFRRRERPRTKPS